MPWFPEYSSAVELARRQTRAAGLADPVGQYFAALNNGDSRTLETAWPGHVVVFDPRAGQIRGHRQLRRFVRLNQAWLAARHARVETVAATSVPGRAVVELLVSLDGLDAARGDGETVWPVAVVAESTDETSVVFRSYCSQLPVDGQRHLRPAILGPAELRLGDVVARYQAAVEAGDVEAAVETFGPDGYLQEAVGPAVHRGAPALRSYFTEGFSGGGIGRQLCGMTDDGVRCALEYNVVRWGGSRLPPQAGLAVHERGPDGLLAAVRVYDDVEAPADPLTAGATTMAATHSRAD